MNFQELMFDVIGNWKTKDKILDELKNKYDIEIDERYFRKCVENFNKEFRSHNTDGYVIVHSPKGYKITKSTDEMLKSDEDLYKRAMKMLVIVSRNKRTRGENMNLFMHEIIKQINKSTQKRVNPQI
jgi:hypothetical protein